MARVTISTPAAERLEIDDIDDATAALLLERLTVAFGKRGGMWVSAPPRPVVDAEAGAILRWVPSTSNVVVAFDAPDVPERARVLSLLRRPAPEVACTRLRRESSA